MPNPTGAGAAPPTSSHVRANMPTDTPSEKTDPSTGRAVVWRSCPCCAQCNRDAPHLSDAPTQWPLKRCRGCGLVYLEKIPVYAELADTHAWEKSVVSTHRERRRRNPLFSWLAARTRWRLGLLPRRSVAGRVAQTLPDGGVVLDLGCGSGHHLSRLPSHYIPYGVEISAALAQTAREVLTGRGAHIVTGPAITGLRELPDAAVDCTVLRSYLEHEADPAGVLRELARVVKPGGTLLVKVPNYGSLNRRLMGSRWCGYRFPDHVNYFTPGTLRQMLAHHGFPQLAHGLLDRLPVSDNLWGVATRPAG